MKTYEVKFSIYGKKLKVIIEAESKDQALRIIRADLIFHSVKEVETVSDPEFVGNKTAFKNLMDILNLKP